MLIKQKFINNYLKSIIAFFYALCYRARIFGRGNAMQKINLEKCSDLADVFYAVMGGYTDNIREIEAFMLTSPLNKLIHSSDVERIVKYDGFFADETVDAVYALLPVKIPLKDGKSWIMSPQAFRKLNSAQINKPASRLINISFPKALLVYNTTYLEKIREVIHLVNEVKKKTVESVVNDNSNQVNAPQVSPHHNPNIVNISEIKSTEKPLSVPVSDKSKDVSKPQDDDFKNETAPSANALMSRQRKKVEEKQIKKEELSHKNDEASLVPTKFQEKLKKALALQKRNRKKADRIKQKRKEYETELLKEEQQRNAEEQEKLAKIKDEQRKKFAEENPELAKKRETARLRMQKQRAEHPEARKSHYVKYDDLSPEEREKKRLANRERNRIYREKHRLELRQSHNERRARLKAENPELLKEMDKKTNSNRNRAEICQRYYQNHKKELNRKTRKNPMRPIYLERYKLKKKLQTTGPIISALLQGLINSKSR